MKRIYTIQDIRAAADRHHAVVSMASPDMRPKPAAVVFHMSGETILRWIESVLYEIPPRTKVTPEVMERMCAPRPGDVYVLRYSSAGCGTTWGMARIHMLDGGESPPSIMKVVEVIKNTGDMTRKQYRVDAWPGILRRTELLADRFSFIPAEEWQQWT